MSDDVAKKAPKVKKIEDKIGANKVEAKVEEKPELTDYVNEAPKQIALQATIPIPIERLIELEPQWIVLVRNFMFKNAIGPYAVVAENPVET